MSSCQSPWQVSTAGTSSGQLSIQQAQADLCFACAWQGILMSTVMVQNLSFYALGHEDLNSARKLCQNGQVSLQCAVAMLQGLVVPLQVPADPCILLMWLQLTSLLPPLPLGAMTRS